MVPPGSAAISRRSEAYLRIIVAGSRRITSYAAISLLLADSPFQITVLLSGGAKGVDTLAEDWATRHGVDVQRYPLNWKLYRSSAPLVRNCEMANAADGFIGIWDGYSSGTMGMIQAALHYRLPLHVHVLDV